MNDAIGGAIFLMLVCCAISSVWSWWTGRRPGRDERIRTTALELAMDAVYSQADREPDALVTRAKTFEAFIADGRVPKTERTGRGIP